MACKRSGVQIPLAPPVKPEVRRHKYLTDGSVVGPGPAHPCEAHPTDLLPGEGVNLTRGRPVARVGNLTRQTAGEATGQASRLTTRTRVACAAKAFRSSGSVVATTAPP